MLAYATPTRKLSVLEAAQFLNVSVHTIRAWTRSRRLPFLRLGRRVVFDIADLEAFAAAGRVPPQE
jgi:excisionase family DNA binding protein